MSAAPVLEKDKPVEGGEGDERGFAGWGRGNLGEDMYLAVTSSWKPVVFCATVTGTKADAQAAATELKGMGNEHFKKWAPQLWSVSQVDVSCDKPSVFTDDEG